VTFSQFASKAADSIADKYHQELQSRLNTAGWEHSVDVVSNKGQVSLSYNSSSQDDIFTAEYGSISQAPNSVLRGIVEDIQDEVGPATEAAAIEYIFAQGLV
jgi:uncharacterized lipoprotein YajG